MNDLEQRVKNLEGLIFKLIKSDRYFYEKDIQIGDGRDIQFGKTNGTHLGTATDQKVGFFGVTPVVQQTFTGETVGMTTPGGANVQENSAFAGGIGTTKYTIHGLVDVLKIFGFLAP